MIDRVNVWGFQISTSEVETKGSDMNRNSPRFYVLSRCVLFAAITMIESQVNAESFDWTYTDSHGIVQSAGWLEAVPLDNPYPSNLSGHSGLLLAVHGGISASSNVGAGMLLDPVGPGVVIAAPGAFIVDNVLFNTDPNIHGSNLDYWGLLFSESQNNSIVAQVNIWGNGKTNNDPSDSPPAADTLYLWTRSGGYTVTDNGGTFSLTIVPEPSTFALACLGGVGLANGGFRRRRAAAV